MTLDVTTSTTGLTAIVVVVVPDTPDEFVATNVTIDPVVSEVGVPWMAELTRERPGGRPVAVYEEIVADVFENLVSAITGIEVIATLE